MTNVELEFTAYQTNILLNLKHDFYINLNDDDMLAVFLRNKPLFDIVHMKNSH